MRDPNRIEEYVNTLKTIWEKYPDLRFTQLVLNVFGHNPACYYIEDAESLQALINMYLSD